MRAAALARAVEPSRLPHDGETDGRQAGRVEADQLGRQECTRPIGSVLAPVVAEAGLDFLVVMPRIQGEADAAWVCSNARGRYGHGREHKRQEESETTRHG